MSQAEMSHRSRIASRVWPATTAVVVYATLNGCAQIAGLEAFSSAVSTDGGNGVGGTGGAISAEGGQGTGQSSAASNAGSQATGTTSQGGNETASTGGDPSGAEGGDAGSGGDPSGGAGGTSEGGPAGSGGSSAPSGGGGANGGDTSSGAGAGSGGTSGGMGGMSSAGASGSAGDTSVAAPIPSAGCGTAPSLCTDDCTANGIGYIIELPTDYDWSRPYPVVFQFHPMASNAAEVTAMLGVRPEFPDAIYVSQNGSNDGYPNQAREDELVTRAIVDYLNANLCVDTGRYFATGFSYGGSMAYTVAYCISDVFRAVAPLSGANFSAANSCTPERPVAAWITHGAGDTTVNPSASTLLRDGLRAANGCSATTTAVAPSPCVEYENCAQESPVVWCLEPGGGHAIPSYAPQSIADFFQRF